VFLSLQPGRLPGAVNVTGRCNTLMKSLLFFTCCMAAAWATAGTGKMQVRALENLPGASEDLSFKLKCLKSKTYPDDIEKCGLSGFSTAAHQTKVERCLSSGSGKLHPLQVTSNGQYVKVMLVVPCATMKVAAEFEANSGKYSLVHIGEPVD
jgi:hypothetical protein